MKSQDIGAMVPTSLLLLASPLKRKGIDVEILYLQSRVKDIPQNIEDLPRYFDQLLNLFIGYEEVRVVGISAYTSYSFLAAAVIGWALREALPQAAIFVGGYGVSTMPLLIEQPNMPFDFFLIGEGDAIFPQMVEEIIYKKKEVKRGNPAGVIPQKVIGSEAKDLRDIGPIDWDILNGSPLLRSPFLSVPYYASRSCPFLCKFCTDISNFTEYGFQKRWRPMPVEKVMEDLENLHNYFGKQEIRIIFEDPVFGLDKKWKMEMLNRLTQTAQNWERRGFGLEDRVDQMRESDCLAYSKLDSAVAMGFENGSPTMLRRMNKTQDPEWYLQKVHQNQEWLEKNEVYYMINVIFGFPGETMHTMEENISFLQQLFIENKAKFGVPYIGRYTHFPGSYVYANYGTAEFEGLYVHYPNWFHMAADQSVLASMVDPSSGLNFRDVYNHVGGFWREIYPKIQQQLHFKKDKPIMAMALQYLLLNDPKDFERRVQRYEASTNHYVANPPKILPIDSNILRFLKTTPKVAEIGNSIQNIAL
jgi:radical SAM superfamily enzyme YgiQ (UPF0313 family)